VTAGVREGIWRKPLLFERDLFPVLRQIRVRAARGPLLGGTTGVSTLTRPKRDSLSAARIPYGQ